MAEHPDVVVNFSNSDVRIIENTPARVIVHWRYAPVSAIGLTWNIDEKTGWECWIDEYYYIYPDGSAVRHVEWKSGTLGYPRQIQESIPLAGPGQLRGDIMDNPWLTAANQQGDQQVYEYVENPKASKKQAPEQASIQKHNMKSAYDPFIIFETGNRMRYMLDRDIKNLEMPGSCNHWPVGQAYCDGRTGMAADRPTSFLGFPISTPVVSEKDGRSWWNGIYGMTDQPMEFLVKLSNAWNNNPEAELKSTGYSKPVYDRSQRAYVVERLSGNQPLEMKIRVGKDQPLVHPVIVIENPGNLQGKVLSNGKEIKYESKTGFVHTLEGSTLIIFLFSEFTEPVDLQIL